MPLPYYEHTCVVMCLIAGKESGMITQLLIADQEVVQAGKVVCMVEVGAEGQ